MDGSTSCVSAIRSRDLVSIIVTGPVSSQPSFSFVCSKLASATSNLPATIAATICGEAEMDVAFVTGRECYLFY